MAEGSIFSNIVCILQIVRRTQLLEMADGQQRIVKGLEEFRKPG